MFGDELFFIIFSNAGFSDSLAFKHIDNKAISDVEALAKGDLMKLLEDRCICANIPFTQEDKQHFFGDFTFDPHNFRFSDSERCLILSIVHHVKESSDFNNVSKALERLSLNEKAMFTLSSTDWYFKDIPDSAAGILCAREETPMARDQMEPRVHTLHILQKLFDTATQNASRSKGGYRYDPEAKKWAGFLKMIAGPTAYLTLQKNLELALPSLSRTNYFIQNTNNTLIEGVPRFQELLHYLEENNSPLAVTLSEDGTRIFGRVQYDSKKNQLSGFVLPTNQNGMPIPFVYKARNTEEIVNHFTNDTPIASFVNIVMAQPLAQVPPLCILLFGTHSKYTAMDVSNRWNYFVSKLKELNITVLGISSDSDPRYNSAMRRNSSLGYKSDVFANADWFKCGQRSAGRIQFLFYIQDTIHLATKLRNFLLKTFKYLEMLPFGKKHFIQIAHLRYLIDHLSKCQHKLTESILNPTDRQNFKSVLCISTPEIISLLKKHVPGSDATVKFLELLRNFIDAYMDMSLSPLERVSKLWYSIFMVRLWRRFIVANKSLTLKNNFLTSNCYSCMELNAHSLVSILLYLRATKQPHLFLPWLFSSQPCESFFRQIRSLSSCYSTVTNCTVKEMSDRIHKIQLQNEISSDANTSFIDPRKLKSSVQWPAKDIELPTGNEIVSMISECRKQAIVDALKFGLISNKDRNVRLTCKIVSSVPKRVKHSACGETLPNDQAHAEVLSQLRKVNLKNFADKFGDEEVDETSPYTEVFGGRKRIVIKKMSLCWLLRKNAGKLSSDRLVRVMGCYKNKTRNNQKNTSNNQKKNCNRKPTLKHFSISKFIQRKIRK